jgi:hypothetical protein
MRRYPSEIEMAIRYTVYCKQNVSAVTPEQLLAGVPVADLHTLAEAKPASGGDWIGTFAAIAQRRRVTAQVKRGFE